MPFLMLLVVPESVVLWLRLPRSVHVWAVCLLFIAYLFGMPSLQAFRRFSSFDFDFRINDES